MSMAKNKLISLISAPLFLLILLGCIWGTGYSIARFAMTNGVNALGYSFWQSIGPALVLSWIGLLTYKQQRGIRLRDWRYYFVCGMTGMAIPNTIMYFAAAHLPAGLLAVIVNTVPLIAYLMALYARVEIFSWRRLSAVMLGLAGIMLILIPTANLQAGELVWVLTALLTPFSFAYCAVHVTRHQPLGTSSVATAAITLIFSTLVLTPLVVGTGSFYVLHWPLNLPDGVIVLEIFLSSLGYVLFYQLIRSAGPVYYSFVDAIVALTGLLWGWLLFSEKLTWLSTLGVTFIVLALILVNKRFYQKKILSENSQTQPPKEIKLRI
jgi:drug/metabolite transporter (DMT)-like permease